MKKDYIKPEIRFEEFELKDCLLLPASYIQGGGELGGDINDSKDRKDDAEWGDLW
jgi:hypothetical protein